MGRGSRSGDDDVLAKRKATNAANEEALLAKVEADNKALRAQQESEAQKQKEANERRQREIEARNAARKDQ